MAVNQKMALLSVWDKEGILDLAKGLERQGVRLLASGGTERIINEAGIPVENVSAITGKSSILQGRVKTLHQAVHGGILATDKPEDQSDLANEKIQMIDFVICNLYPFKETAQKVNVTIPEAVEEIDIGGVTLLRAAAKNHARVTAISDPKDYREFLRELQAGGISEETRQRFALKAFEQTASYDEAIAGFFRKRYAGDGIQELSLRYGTNPHQKPAAAFVKEQGKLPFKVLNGSPGYINLLDALNAWPLVKELKQALDLPAAASFKHVSPAGAAVGVPMTQEEKEVCMVTTIEGLSDSGLAQAYARARGADRVSSFGDIIALSDEVDLPTAKIISMEVSDGVIAPGYSKAALEILARKKGGKYLILEVDPSYETPATETRTVFGIQLSQHRNDVKISPSDTFSTVVTKSSPSVPESALRDLTVATTALKYTQSNSVCYALNGQTIGLGAGQQSRIHCTRLAGDKADSYWMRFHPRVRALRFKKGVKRPDRSNAIDMLCSGQTALERASAIEQDDYRDNFEALFEDAPPSFTAQERKDWLGRLENVVVSSDAFFPFTDNVVRAAASGVKYIAAPMGSQADQAVVATAEKAGITFIEQNTRLFHH